MFNLKKAKSLLIAMSLTLSFSSSASAATYKVTPGDSIYKVSKLFGTSTTSLIKGNKISKNTIYPGQILNVPCQTYKVKKGDSIYLIAKRFNVSIGALRKANNKWDNYIYPGQTLNIPKLAVSSVKSSPSQKNKAVKKVVPAKKTAVVKKSSPAKKKAVIKKPTTVKKTASRGLSSYSARDIDLLARLITAEADGQPYKAQVSVAAVVVNRVQDSRFPNSISSVIYERSNGYYQFTPVLNGWINKPAIASAKKAAYEALKGSDPTNGALYYFDDSTKNKWLWSKKIAYRIGKMVFTYYN